jgi:hypothetical protein
MQCACAILSPVTCTALQYFSTLSHKRHVFEAKKLLNTNVCFDFLYKVFLKYFFILRRNERDIIKKMYICLHVKYLLFLSDFNET